MQFPVINSRADLDLLSGTPEYDVFMRYLAGTLWRYEADHDAKMWRAIPDDSVIAAFGFERSDFPNVVPEPPAYLQPEVSVPAVVTMRQARLALLQAGLLQSVSEAIASMPGAEGDAARIELEYAQEVRRDWPVVVAIGDALGLGGEQLDALFRAAALM